MAKLEISGIDNNISSFSKLEQDITDILKRAVVAGANPVADEVRSSLENLKEDKFRKLADDEMFSGVPGTQKKDLLEGLGITPVDTDENGFINVKIGFSGYGSYPSKKYPKGLPNSLLARAIESGSSVRRKTPFVRKAAYKVKEKAINEMQLSIENDMKTYVL